MESAKWYLGAYWGPWWKRKYPQIITRQKVSERLLSDVWLHLIELRQCFLEPFPRTVSVDSEKWYFRWLWRIEREKKYPPRKSGVKLSEKLLCDMWIHFTVLHHPFSGEFASTHFEESQMWCLGYRWIAWWIRNYPQRNLQRSLLRNFFVVGEFSPQTEKLTSRVFPESAVGHTVALRDHK